MNRTEKFLPLQFQVMLKTFFISLLCLPTLCFSQNTTGDTGSDVSPADAKEIVEHHNKARKEFNIAPLKWSATLAAYAQAWADSLVADGACNFKHRQNGDYGENIYMASSSASFKPVTASLAWYAEKERYTYSKIGEPGSAKAMHYTQMIWKNTTEVGVGMAVCNNGNVVVVANYNPSGNYRGEYPY